MTTTRQRSFYWKIGYVAGIGLLVGILYWIGHPSTLDSKTGRRISGGQLAKLRAQYGLSEADLGEIDPAGETIKLATLGLRGIAVNVLWHKANTYKMKKDWTNLSATLEQIAKLQPHFIAVWQHQAWNLSYNVSAEFDDYKDRYRWVIRGLDFLMQGVDKNEYEPKLLWDQGWFTAQKIGRADEHIQFRRLFREDEDYHASLPPELRDPTNDNWLCGKQCFLKAERLVADGHKMDRKSPVVFHSNAPMCQINYSEALEKDGTFGEKAREAWRLASAEWKQFGSINIQTTYNNPSTGEFVHIHLNDREAYEEKARLKAKELDDLGPEGLREKIREEKEGKLTKLERDARATPHEKRTTKQHELVAGATRSLEVSHEEVARRIKGSKGRDARRLAEEARRAEQIATYISRYRQIVNFDYWRLRCQIELTEEATDARAAIHRGETDAAAGKLDAARGAYDDGLAKWRQLLDKFPELAKDETTGEDLIETIGRYEKLLKARDEKMPEDFILQDVLDRFGKKG